MTQPTRNPSSPLVAGLLTSIIRTVVPLVLAPLLTWAAKAGLDVDSTAIATLIGTVLTVIYYAVVRSLETIVKPAWGWLLGVAKVPAYPQAVNTTAVEVPPGAGLPHGD